MFLIKNIFISLFLFFLLTSLYAAPPVFQSIGEERLLNSEIFVTEGEKVTFQVVATDPDGDTLTYNAENVPPWGSFNSSTGTFSGTAPLWPSDYESRRQQPGSYDITFKVSDGKYTVSKIVSVYVLDSTWKSKTMAELVKNRHISSGGDIGSSVEIYDVKDETVWTTHGGGKNIRKITFGFVSQVPDVEGWENDWVSDVNYAYLPVNAPAVDNVGAVVEGGYLGTYGDNYFAQKVCAELNIPVLIIDMDWELSHGSDVMTKCNEKSIETGDPEYLFYSFSTAHFLRAADALVTIIKTYTDWSVSYDTFKVVFTGHSKFGNTCFKAAAAASDRVVGFMASGTGSIDSDAIRVLSISQGGESFNPESSSTYLGTMMRYYVENLLLEKQMDSNVKALSVVGTDDKKNDTEEYSPKYVLYVSDNESTLQNFLTGAVPNAPHTTATFYHYTYWNMWLAHCFLDRPISEISGVNYTIDNDNITVEAVVTGEPEIKSVRVWATNQSDLDISSWDNFTAYKMTLENNSYKGEIPKDSKAFFIEVDDEYDGIDGIITSPPTPTDRDYPYIPQPPDNIDNLTVTSGSSSLKLSWDNPSSDDFSGVVIFSSNDEFMDLYGSSAFYDDNNTETTLNNEGKNIYFSAYTYDKNGNYSSGTFTKVCNSENNEKSTFDLTTGILKLPEVTVGSESYSVFMSYDSGMDFYLTKISYPLCSVGESASFDFETSILSIPEVVVGDTTYKVNMEYSGGLTFTVTDIE